MAWTDYRAAGAFQEAYLHTFNALQKLVLAMAKYQNCRGKRTWFGRDKGLEAYKSLESALLDSLLAMTMDGIIKRNASPRECRTTLIEVLKPFQAIFPNWQDAYCFAEEYLVRDAAVTEDRIRHLFGSAAPAGPQVATVHFTGPDGDYDASMTIGVDIPVDAYRGAADAATGDLYGLAFYEQGVLKRRLVPRTIWEQARDALADIDREAAEAAEAMERSLDRLKKL
jgi:hypothetical protein